MRMSVRKRVIIIDAHVHIHNCFDLSVFLDSAHHNFMKVAQQLEVGDAFEGVLLLAECSNAHWFQQLQEIAMNGNSFSRTIAGDWNFHRTEEPYSLRASRSGHKELIIGSGRQIVTSEKLEVLALGTDKYFPDGAPLKEVIESVHGSDAITVLPWGFGKWIGRRGAIIKDLLETDKGSNFFLGDNGGRLLYSSYPRYFKLAHRKGLRILPGSDPLPFPSEVWRPGSFGFIIKHFIDESTPVTDIKFVLANKKVEISSYGELENPYRFLKNQLAMQFKKLDGAKLG